MKSKIIFIIAITAFFSIPANAQSNLAQKFSGRILLQVQSRGEAWYVNPADKKRYFLGRPADAFNLMKKLGVGITDNDLAKIPTPGIEWSKISFAKENAGKIFLQIEGQGQAWYVNPTDYSRHFLGRPSDAWQIMRRLGLGITNKNLDQITIGRLALVAVKPAEPPAPVAPPTPPATQNSLLSQAASSIRSNNSTQAQACFVESMRKSIEYSLAHLSADSRLLLANILSGASLTSSSETEKIYSNKAYFSLGGYDVPLTFRVKKQDDGSWLIANL